MDKKNRVKPYAQYQQFEFIMPYQFILLCRMLQVTPEQVLYSFMCNVGQESYAQGDEQKLMAMEYIIACKHGQSVYGEADIREMITGLDTISTLWPWKGKTLVTDRLSRFRKRYHQYWYRKYYRRRNLLK